MSHFGHRAKILIRFDLIQGRAEPAACLVIEDSPNGVLAARATGMRCVAVPNPVTRHLEMPEAALVVESLEGIRLSQILSRI